MTNKATKNGLILAVCLLACVIIFALGRRSSPEKIKTEYVQEKSDDVFSYEKWEKLQSDIMSAQQRLDDINIQASRVKKRLFELDKHKSLETEIANDEKLLREIRTQIAESTSTLLDLGQAEVEADFPEKRWKGEVTRGLTSLSYPEWIRVQTQKKNAKMLKELEMENRCIALLVYLGNNEGVYNFEFTPNQKIYSVREGEKLSLRYRDIKYELSLGLDGHNVVFYPIRNGVPDIRQPRFVDSKEESSLDIRIKARGDQK